MVNVHWLQWPQQSIPQGHISFSRRRIQVLSTKFLGCLFRIQSDQNTHPKRRDICVVVLSNIMWQQVGSLCPVPFFLMTKCPHHWCYQSGAKLTNTVCVTLWWIRREGLLDCEVLLFAWIAFSLYILGRCSISVGKLLFEFCFTIYQG